MCAQCRNSAPPSAGVPLPSLRSSTCDLTGCSHPSAGLDAAPPRRRTWTDSTRWRLRSRPRVGRPGPCRGRGRGRCTQKACSGVASSSGERWLPLRVHCTRGGGGGGGGGCDGLFQTHPMMSSLLAVSPATWDGTNPSTIARRRRIRRDLGRVRASACARSAPNLALHTLQHRCFQPLRRVPDGPGPSQEVV